MASDRVDPSGLAESGARPAPTDLRSEAPPHLSGMSRPWQRSFSDADVVRIAADVSRQGYAVLGHFVSEQELEPVRALIHASLGAAHGEYVDFRGPDALEGTVLSNLPKAASFKDLCRRLYELGAGRAAPEVEFYQVLRCLQGRAGQTRSWYFHYDSYVVTVLLPVAIPSEGPRGDLLMIPNTRRLRRSYLANLLDKVLIENSLAQTVLRSITRRKRFNTVSIQLQPGNIYLFWGYRSIHTNEACDPDKLRATALFHYGNPHEGSRLRRLLQRRSAPNGAGHPKPLEPGGDGGGAEKAPERAGGSLVAGGDHAAPSRA